MIQKNLIWVITNNNDNGNDNEGGSNDNNLLTQ
jgi:hypothetical protein